MQLDTDWSQLTVRCKEAMVLASTKPGRHGGRHVGRYFNRATGKTEFVVLGDDDWDLTPSHVDVLAHVTHKQVYPIWAARNYLQSNGDVVFTR